MAATSPPATANPAPSHSTMVASSNSTPSRRTSIFDLPQELQDMIFEYTYAASADTMLSRVASRPDNPSSDLPFSTKRKVEEWLVCKKWLIAAARAYAQSKVIPVRVAMAWTKGVLHAFGRDFMTDAIWFGKCKQSSYPEMRTLQLELYDPYSTRILSRLTSVASDFHANAIADEAFEAIVCFRGLRKLSVTPEPNSYSNRQPDVDHVLRCLQIQELMECIVLRSSLAEGQQESNGTYCNSCYERVPSLYFGSRVCSNDHTAGTQAKTEVQHHKKPHDHESTSAQPLVTGTDSGQVSLDQGSVQMPRQPQQEQQQHESGDAAAVQPPESDTSSLLEYCTKAELRAIYREELGRQASLVPGSIRAQPPIKDSAQNFDAQRDVISQDSSKEEGTQEGNQAAIPAAVQAEDERSRPVHVSVDMPTENHESNDVMLKTVESQYLGGETLPRAISTYILGRFRLLWAAEHADGRWSRSLILCLVLVMGALGAVFGISLVLEAATMAGAVLDLFQRLGW